MSKLTAKQEKFCKEYIVSLNATQASIKAGYSEKTAKAIGTENLSKPAIQKRIQELSSGAVKKHEITVDMIIKELAAIAFLDVSSFYTATGDLKAIHDIDETARKAIASVSARVVKEGEDFVDIKTIKANDKLKALELLGRYHKMFTDKIEHSGDITITPAEWLQGKSHD